LLHHRKEINIWQKIKILNPPLRNFAIPSLLQIQISQHPVPKTLYVLPSPNMRDHFVTYGKETQAITSKFTVF
jgi:hypothetical protein